MGTKETFKKYARQHEEKSLLVYVETLKRGGHTKEYTEQLAGVISHQKELMRLRDELVDANRSQKSINTKNANLLINVVKKNSSKLFPFLHYANLKSFGSTEDYLQNVYTPLALSAKSDIFAFVIYHGPTCYSLPLQQLFNGLTTIPLFKKGVFEYRSFSEDDIEIPFQISTSGLSTESNNYSPLVFDIENPEILNDLQEEQMAFRDFLDDFISNGQIRDEHRYDILSRKFIYGEFMTEGKTYQILSKEGKVTAGTVLYYSRLDFMRLFEIFGQTLVHERFSKCAKCNSYYFRERRLQVGKKNSYCAQCNVD